MVQAGFWAIHCTLPAKRAENGTDDLDKIAILHDKIVREVDYAYYTGTSTPVSEKWAHSVHGIFKKKLANAEINLSAATLTPDQETYFYTGSAVEPKPVVTCNGSTLIEGADYTLSYENNTDIGNSAKVTVTGTGNFTGSVSMPFAIVKWTHTHAWGEPEYTWAEDNGSVTAERVCQAAYCDIGKETATVTTTFQDLSGPTCTENGLRKYTAVFESDVFTTQTKDVAVPAKGHDYGAWTKLNDTQHQRVCSNDASHKETQNHTWNNGSITTPATATTAGEKLFTCTACGATRTETIEPTGSGSGGGDAGGGGSGGGTPSDGGGTPAGGGGSGGGGSGGGGGAVPGDGEATPEPTAPTDEDIAAAGAVSDAIAVLPAKITLDQESAVKSARDAYDALTDAQKDLVSDATLKKLTDAEITISAWKQYNTDVETAKAVTTKLNKVSNTKGRKASISWTPASGNTGYIIQYSTNKKFKKGVKKVNINDPTGTTATVKKLKKGKTYYFRIYTYTEVNNAATGETTTVSGKISGAKKIKIKK